MFVGRVPDSQNPEKQVATEKEPEPPGREFNQSCKKTRNRMASDYSYDAKNFDEKMAELCASGSLCNALAVSAAPLTQPRPSSQARRRRRVLVGLGSIVRVVRPDGFTRELASRHLRLRWVPGCTKLPNPACRHRRGGMRTMSSSAGFEKPSAIQQKGIVPFGKGLDVIQQAQSGTGKTATFCAGILQRLDYGELDCQALVLAPTRELAQQIEKVMRALGDYLEVSNTPEPRASSAGSADLLSSTRIVTSAWLELPSKLCQSADSTLSATCTLQDCGSAKCYATRVFHVLSFWT